MLEDHDDEALLITGVYGSGKSTVAVEIADVLEKASVPYAVMDLDWLSWADPGTEEAGAEHRMMLKNLAAVVANYREAGVRFFVLAHAIRSATELDGVRDRLPVPLRVVRLVVGLEEIERRLASDITAGRQDDLREAAAWLGASEGQGIEDLTVLNDRPIREVAMEILERVGWT